MDWLDKLKQYTPDIAAAIVSGGATLPQLAMKAIGDATGRPVENIDQLGDLIASATPETMLQVKHADQAFKIRMAELGNELIATELADIQSARQSHKHSSMPAMICGVLTFAIIMFGVTLMMKAIPTGNGQLINTLFGSFLTAWLGSVSYWVGTTRSSADKTVASIKGK